LDCLCCEGNNRYCTVLTLVGFQLAMLDDRIILSPLHSPVPTPSEHSQPKQTTCSRCWTRQEVDNRRGLHIHCMESHSKATTCLCDAPSSKRGGCLVHTRH